MRIGRILFLVGGLLAMLVLLSGCGSDTTDSTSNAAPTVLAASTTYVGVVEDSNAYIAMVIENGSVLAYVCDGEKTWDYLSGSVTGTTIAVGADPADLTITGEITGDSISGTMTSDGGEIHNFRLEAVTGDAGFYTQEIVDGDTVLQGGWIRLADGQVRGKQVAIVAGSDGDIGLAEQQPAPAPQVPPDAEPASLRGMVRCGIAGARVAVAGNRLGRDNTSLNQTILENRQEEASLACQTHFTS